MKVAELSGTKLDYWVARAEGLKKGQTNYVAYSTAWGVGGPIIERERITVSFAPMLNKWRTGTFHSATHIDLKHIGDTALEAAMRCYVASKYGEDVPDVE